METDNNFGATVAMDRVCLISGELHISNILVQARVIVHSMVQLGVIDRFNRIFKESAQVVSCLFGSWRANGVVDVTNSFAVSFNEEASDRLSGT